MTQTGDRDAAFDKPLAYEANDGRVVYRASGLGACRGALVRARLGVTGSLPSDFMQTRFDEGTDWEDAVIAAGLGVDWVQMTDPEHLVAFGKVVDSNHGRVQLETEIAWGNKIVRCHPDAIASQGSTLQPWVVEAKFLSEDYALEKIRAVDKHGLAGLGEQYAWQAAVEMLSTGLPLLYIIGTKDVVEVDGERVVRGVGSVWTGEFEASDSPYQLRDVKARVLEVEGYVARGEVPSCPLPLMYPCAYWADHADVEQKPEIADEALVEWVEVWRIAKARYAESTSAMDEVRGEILARMDELGLDGGVCKGVTISVVGEGQGNVAWAKWAKDVKAKHPEVKDVDEEQYRGKPREGYVKIEEAKG